jgi:hypothetical protein
LAYAMAQDNNHGTSEAAALFMGGDWLARQATNPGRAPESVTAGTFTVDARQARAWAQAGRRWLENRAARLIEPDGGFSQYSVNYHRLMLDTLCLAELWRQWFDLPAFSERFYARARAATDWLRAMVDPETGDAPNLGANDGANLLPLTDADYRDYRPTVQLATALFAGERAYAGAGPHDDHLAWLGVESRVGARPARESASEATATAGLHAGRPPTTGQARFFHAKGYIVLRIGPWKALFRYPHYRFRPGHCDALHVDLWRGSENLLRDAGSYSYNAEPGMSEYFTGPAGHNTVQFDDRDPMPRIGPFLRGAWLKTESVSEPHERDGALHVAVSYRDWQGARHRREVSLGSGGLRVVDEVSGFQTRAVLRWRLSPGDWQINGNTVSCERAAPDTSAVSPPPYHERSAVMQVTADLAAAEHSPLSGLSTPRPTVASTAGQPALTKHSLSIQASVPMHSLQIVSGWESRYYLDKNPLPVLEVELREPGHLISEYRLES